LLQWPAGRVSDRVDRRLVIAALAFMAAVTAFALALWSGQLTRLQAVALFFLWGGGGWSFSGIAVANMADRAEPGKLAQSAAGVLFVWAGGSGIGPLVMGPLVDWFGVGGLFWVAGAVALAVTLLMFWRQSTREGPAAKEDYVADMGVSVASGEMAYGEDKPAPPPATIARAGNPR